MTGAARDAGREPGTPALWLGAGLGIAFSPVLVDLARNLAAEPGDRVSLVGLACFGTALWAERSRPRQAPKRGLGIAVVGLALGLEILGIAAASWSIARLALPLAVVGLAWFAGRPRAGAAMIAFAAVPLPDTLVSLASPTAESALARLVAASLQGMGASVHATSFSLVSPAGRLDLGPGDVGLPVAVALAAVGWTRALLREAPPRAWIRGAVGWAALGLAIAILSTWAAAALLAAGVPTAARIWLELGAPLAAAALAAWGLWRPR